MGSFVNFQIQCDVERADLRLNICRHPQQTQALDLVMLNQNDLHNLGSGAASSTEERQRLLSPHRASAGVDSSFTTHPVALSHPSTPLGTRGIP